MMADDDDLQNMTSIIDLDGTQSSSNDKETKILFYFGFIFI